MPQLPSGLRVAVSISPYLDALDEDNENAAYYAVIALSLHASTPEDLMRHAVVGVIPEGLPVDGTAYRTGYCVADILEGRSDWSAEDVEAFREFLASDRVRVWLAEDFAELMAAIREHPVWQSPLCEGFHDPERLDVPALKRAVIGKSAMESSSMAFLRRPRSTH